MLIKLIETARARVATREGADYSSARRDALTLSFSPRRQLQINCNNINNNVARGGRDLFQNLSVTFVFRDREGVGNSRSGFQIRSFESDFDSDVASSGMWEEWKWRGGRGDYLEIRAQQITNRQVDP